jgi:hypothetical protein
MPLECQRVFETSRPYELRSCILLFGRGSAVMSSRWTTYSPRNLSTKPENRSLRILPSGRRRARTLAGAMGSRESWLIVADSSWGRSWLAAVHGSLVGGLVGFGLWKARGGPKR